MSILERNKHLFSMVIRERGSQYYEKNRVEINYEDATSVMAEVQGSDLYDVDVEWKNGDLGVSCTCPHAQENFCKHIYAVLLKIDRENLLPGVGRNAALSLRLYSSGELLYISDDEGGVLPPNFRPPNDGRQPWRSRLDDIHTILIQQRTPDIPVNPESRQIVYVIRQSSGYYYHEHARDLVVNIFSRNRKKNGSWGQIKSVNISADKMEQFSGEDATIASILLGAQGMYDYSRSSYGSLGFVISRPLAEVVLPPMTASGRLYYQNDRDETLRGPLSWHAREVWTPALVLKPAAAGSGHECALELRSPEGVMAVNDPAIITRQGIMVVGTRLCRLDDLGAFPWIEKMRGQKSLSIPDADVSDFVRKIYSLPGLPPLSFPDEWKAKEVCAEAKACLVLRTQESHYYLQDKKRFRATLYFKYRNCPVAAFPQGRGFYAETEGCYLLRNDESENSAYQSLAALGFKTAREMDDGATHEIDADKFARVVSELTARGWHIEADGKLYREAGAFSFNVTTGIDWFELDGDCRFENQKAGLPALLAALNKRQTLIELPDGTFGVIPEAALKQYALLAQMGEVSGGRLRFKQSQAGLLDALLASQPEVTCDALFENVRLQLQNFSGIGAAPAPESFQGTLRRYQEESLGWFEFLRRFRFGGCLADDMGLGKTVQVLALLEKRRLLRLYAGQTAADEPVRRPEGPDDCLAPSLVVAPRSVIFNWRREAARFTPRMRVLEHTGLGRKTKSEHFANYDLVLTTYGTLRRDAAAFRNIAFDYVILDEAQAIKNSDTAAAKSVRLLKASHRLALSGTPVENHIGELWSLFEFLNPGLLGSAAVFKRNTADASAAEPGTRALLSQALKPFILRRTKAHVAPELPQKTEQVVYCEMDKAQTKLYNELRDHYRRSLLKQLDQEGIGKARMHILEALLRLRQAACHPGLLDPKWQGASAKTEFLLPQLSEILEEGHKALIFSQFTSFLSIVKKQLDENGYRYLYLDGKTKNREQLVRAFQEDAQAPLFLISLRAGGLGLNLTAAEYVYLMDPWWNPAVEAQAIDRTHRIGQTQQVFAYRLITRNTVEERVLELQQSKRDLFAALIQEDASLLRGLNREDLEILLS